MSQSFIMCSWKCRNDVYHKRPKTRIIFAIDAINPDVNYNSANGHWLLLMLLLWSCHCYSGFPHCTLCIDRVSPWTYYAVLREFCFNITYGGWSTNQTKTFNTSQTTFIPYKIQYPIHKCVVLLEKDVVWRLVWKFKKKTLVVFCIQSSILLHINSWMPSRIVWIICIFNDWLMASDR